MKTKTCSKCNKTKELSMFYYHEQTLDNLRSECKSCKNKSSFLYRKTKNGVICQAYHRQLVRSSMSGFEDIAYSKNEFYDWIINVDLFHELYEDWVKIGYERDYIPSVDRIDDYKGYSLDNVQLMTWKNNREKAISDIKNGINNKINKRVYKFNSSGVFIKEYHSVRSAGRLNDICSSGISACASGKTKQAGGFIWKYENK